MAYRRVAWPRRPNAPLKLIGAAAVLFGLSACASPHHAYRLAPSSSQVREYAPPGSPSDPWGPYIAEASTRFAVPETWIREVMRQESGGREYVGGALIISSKGAMGLMQVMPETYEEMRGRYGLGADPYHPRNNILAGTAYIREMYDRFGSPAFLAAYNAGPRRLEDYLYRGLPLPGETVAYVTAVAPRLGSSVAPSGQLAMYARAVPEVSADELNRSSLNGRSASMPAAPLAATGYVGTDADTSADDLNRRMLQGALSRTGVAALPSEPAALPIRTAADVSAEDLNRRALATIQRATPGAGGWGVQVGAFSGSMQARAAAESARAQAGNLLGAAEVAIAPTVRSDGVVLYRARLIGLSAGGADEACSLLAQRRTTCIVVAPDQRT